MIVRKEPIPKLKLSSKAKPKTSVKFKSNMGAKDPKNPSFLTSIKNWSKLSQPKARSCTSKRLKIILEKFSKKETSSLVDENTDSFKNEEKEKAFDETELG